MSARGRGWGRLLWAIAPLAAGQQAPAPASPQAVFRASTKLVQVNVIAQDPQGKPVADLRQDDFQILDNGAPQEIRLFIPETIRPDAGPLHQAAPGFFTNQSAPSGARSGSSVILFDNLVTEFGEPFGNDGTGRGVQQVLQTLQGLPPGERIAIYSIGRKLRVIREFTTDRESLEAQLRAWKPSPDDAKRGTALCIAAPTGPEGAGLRGRQDAFESCIRNDALQRQDPFDQELKQIADHLWGVPGRKKLIWMASQWPAITPAALQRFINANVAIYTVDENGAKGEGAPPFLAQLTGGLSYSKRNDLDGAVHEALEDGRISYTLGFYERVLDSDRAGAPSVHRLEVRLSRPGVALRYRTSYQTEVPAADRPTSVQDLVDALNRPVDATAMAITASATRRKDRLVLTATMDLSTLDLDLQDGLWKGKIEVVVRFMAANGVQSGEATAGTVILNLRPATYGSMLESGVPYRKELTIPAKAVELKLLVGNLRSGRIGTLTIPLTDLPGR